MESGAQSFACLMVEAAEFSLTFHIITLNQITLKQHGQTFIAITAAKHNLTIQLNYDSNKDIESDLLISSIISNT